MATSQGNGRPQRDRSVGGGKATPTPSRLASATNNVGHSATGPSGGHNATTHHAPSAAAHGAAEGPQDLDVTVLAFAQWVSEMKTRQSSSQSQLRADLCMIRSAIGSNRTDLTDFKRHSAAIQQHMQAEIGDIREGLTQVFAEVTGAVRGNASSDQDMKLKISSLNELAVRNETAFAQLAEATDVSQSKLRSAVAEMSLASERMRDELNTLTTQTENMEASVNERSAKLGSDMDQLVQDVHLHLERRREHLRKMVADVVGVGEALQDLVADFGDQRKGTGDTQTRVQSTLSAINTQQRETSRPRVNGAGGELLGRGLPATVDVVNNMPPQAIRQQQQQPLMQTIAAAPGGGQQQPQQHQQQQFQHHHQQHQQQHQQIQQQHQQRLQQPQQHMVQHQMSAAAPNGYAAGSYQPQHQHQQPYQQQPFRGCQDRWANAVL